MLKKALLTAIILVAVIGVICWMDYPSQSSYQFGERNDLTAISFSNGNYYFFFEDHDTMRAEAFQIQPKFNASLDKPIVRAGYVYGGSGKPPTSGFEAAQMTLREVTVVFRDRSQMREYWPQQCGN